jgi:HEPN domain-containing protein
MNLPDSEYARPFFRAGKERYEDAQILLEKDRFTGAIYLGGYALECMLKALIINRSPRSKQEHIALKIKEYGHNLDQLRAALKKRQLRLPPVLADDFRTTGGWKTDIRYMGAKMPKNYAVRFCQSVKRVYDWAEGSM